MVYTTNIDLINTTPITLSTKSDVYLVDATSLNSGMLITLPLITANGMKYKLKRIDDTNNTVTIQGTSGQLIDGNLTYTLYSKTICEVQSYNFTWYLIENMTTSSNSGLVNFIFNTGQNNTIPYILYKNQENWLPICNFIYKGTIINDSSINRIVVLYNTLYTDNITYTIRLVNYDDNSTQICIGSLTGSASTVQPTVRKLVITSFTSVPTIETIFEFQVYLSNGNNRNGINIYAILVN